MPRLVLIWQCQWNLQHSGVLFMTDALDMNEHIPMYRGPHAVTPSIQLRCLHRRNSSPSPDLSYLGWERRNEDSATFPLEKIDCFHSKIESPNVDYEGSTDRSTWISGLTQLCQISRETHIHCHYKRQSSIVRQSRQILNHMYSRMVIMYNLLSQ